MIQGDDIAFNLHIMFKCRETTSCYSNFESFFAIWSEDGDQVRDAGKVSWVTVGTNHYNDWGWLQDTEELRDCDWQVKIWAWETQQMIYGHGPVSFITGTQNILPHLMKNNNKTHSHLHTHTLFGSNLFSLHKCALLNTKAHLVLRFLTSFTDWVLLITPLTPAFHQKTNTKVWICPYMHCLMEGQSL